MQEFKLDMGIAVRAALPPGWTARAEGGMVHFVPPGGKEGLGTVNYVNAGFSGPGGPHLDEMSARLSRQTGTPFVFASGDVALVTLPSHWWIWLAEPKKDGLVLVALRSFFEGRAREAEEGRRLFESISVLRNGEVLFQVPSTEGL
ncbi:MAG: hypothetical protein K6E40_12710 [Desulfovibrio sp.]|nr:hypothetical protein [Desulfovibrio sp.]